MASNRRYRTSRLVEYFRANRCRWDQFYESERKIMERLPLSPQSRVLDMGCACGGLGAALKERFGVVSYTGVELNEECVTVGRTLHPWEHLLALDFLDAGDAIGSGFDAAFSLSCADWNVRTEELFRALFERVAAGGSMVFSCRLSPEVPLSPGEVAYEQEIHYGDENGDPELAAYKVYHPERMIALIRSFGPVASVEGFGYWGKVPASVRRMPLARLHYTVFAVKRAPGTSAGPFRLKLDVDSDLLA